MSTSYAAPIEVIASVDKSVLSVNDQLTYSVTIKGDSVPSDLPIEFPVNLQQFFSVLSSGRSQSYSMVNGNTSMSIVYRLVLQAHAEGVANLVPSKVVLKGTEYASQPLSVTVSSVTPSQPLQKKVPQQDESAQSATIFAHASVDSDHVYVGQKIEFRLQFFRRIRLWSNISFELPKFEGFWVDERPKQDQEMIQSVKGLNYYSQDIARYALYPLKPGKYYIDPASISFVINPFDGNRLVKSQPLTLYVDPLPEGKPQNFSGAVGEFDLMSMPYTYVVTQNTPVTIKIELKGTGNLKGVNGLDYLKTDALQIYQSSVEDAALGVESGLSKRVFEYVMVPRGPGDQKVPTFSISYFSVKERGYKLLSIPSKRIKVQPSDRPAYVPDIKESFKMKKDLLYLKALKYPLKEARPFYQSLLFYLWMIMNAFVSVVLLFYWVNSRFFKWEMFRIFKKKNQDAFKQQIRVLGKKEEITADDFSFLYGQLLDYVSKKTTLPLQGLSLDELRVAMKTKLSEESVTLLVSILDGLSYSAFTPETKFDQSMQDSLKTIEQFIKEIENQC